MSAEDQIRIVVTGIGAVTSLGLNPNDLFSNARKGSNGIHRIERFDVSRMNANQGGEITNFDILDFFPNQPSFATLGRTKQMALVAAKQCIDTAKFEVTSNPFEVGVAIGFTQGEIQVLEACVDRIETGGLDDPDARAFAEFAASSIPQAIATHFRAYGPNLSIGNACAAGNFAIGQSLEILRRGEAKAMIAGGSDDFSRNAFAGFARLGAIAPDVPRPFSINRQGMVPAEGSALLFLETLHSAKSRGAHIYAEIKGYGESCDGNHLTQPDSQGIARALRSALSDALIPPDQVSMISAHGTGTVPNDVAEYGAFKNVFCDNIPPVVAIKSMLGHSMGAASAIECVASILSIQEQCYLPTMNWIGPDEACPVDCVPNEERSGALRIFIKTASGFGGNNAALVFERFQEEEVQ